MEDTDKFILCSKQINTVTVMQLWYWPISIGKFQPKHQKV